MPYCVAINKSEPTDKIIFVCLDRNVNSDEFSVYFSTCLFTENVLPLPDKPVMNIG